MMQFNDQNRSFRRCRFIVHIADVSAWGAHQRAIGRYIGGAPINCAPTRYYRCCLLKIIIGGNRHQSKKSPSNSVGARAGRGGGEGLYGRPRPVPCAHLWSNALTPPAPGDHQGPPVPTSSALAPTETASCNRS